MTDTVSGRTKHVFGSPCTALGTPCTARGRPYTTMLRRSARSSDCYSRRATFQFARRQNSASSPSNRLRNDSAKRCTIRDDPNLILDDLKKAALDREPALTATNAQRPLPQKRHHRRVSGENSDLTVERRNDNRIGLALE